MATLKRLSFTIGLENKAHGGLSLLCALITTIYVEVFFLLLKSIYIPFRPVQQDDPPIVKILSNK